MVWGFNQLLEFQAMFEFLQLEYFINSLIPKRNLNPLYIHRILPHSYLIWIELPWQIRETRCLVFAEEFPAILFYYFYKRGNQFPKPPLADEALVSHMLVSQRFSLSRDKILVVLYFYSFSRTLCSLFFCCPFFS